MFTIGKPDGSAGEFKFFRNLDDDIYSPERSSAENVEAVLFPGKKYERVEVHICAGLAIQLQRKG